MYKNHSNHFDQNVSSQKTNEACDDNRLPNWTPNVDIERS